MEKDSLTNFAINFLVVCFLAASVALVAFSKLNTCDDLQTYPNYLMIYYSYLVHSGFSVFVILCVYYYKNKTLRETIVREIKSLIFK